MRQQTAFWLAMLTGALVIAMAAGFAFLQERPELKERLEVTDSNPLSVNGGARIAAD